MYIEVIYILMSALLTSGNIIFTSKAFDGNFYVFIRMSVSKNTFYK